MKASGFSSLRTSTFALRHGLLGLGLGGIGGFLYSYVGSSIYSMSREKWIEHRIILERSPIRILNVIKPQFPPMEERKYIEIGYFPKRKSTDEQKKKDEKNE
jgi:hypothetical protein